MREATYIGYEYQVFIPLLYLRDKANTESVELTQFEMIDYRIKTAQEFAYKDIKVQYETGQTGIDKLSKSFSDYVEVINSTDKTFYILKDNINLDNFYENLLSMLDPEIIQVLTNEETIKSCFKERNLR